eukprot:scaffold331_cov117-Cylindrotheca_fusiformis.AAC.4
MESKSIGFPASMTTLAPDLWKTHILNGLRLVSPRTWYGLMQVSSRSPFSAFQLEKLLDSVLGMGIPMIALILCMKLVERNQHTKFSAPQRILLLSPWMWHCGQQLVLQMSLFLQSVVNFVRNRNRALPSAVEEMRIRTSSNRAFRTHRYDVFLPPPSTTTSQPQEQQQTYEGSMHKAIVILPGALVPHLSYSEIAGRLSDMGFLTIVVSLEPWLLAGPNLGITTRSVRRIMGRVQTLLKIKNLEWTLMGHSMGAFGAMRLYDQFQKQQLKSSKIRNLVLLGVAPFIKECTDLSKYNDCKQSRLLLIQASADFLAELLKDGREVLYSNFPLETTTQHDILGGTHHGFASYIDDQDALITYQEQQQQVCDLVCKFLNGAE